MKINYLQSTLALIGVGSVGIAVVLPIAQVQSQPQGTALAQPVQDADFFLKRAIATVEKESTPEAIQSALKDLDQAIKLNPKLAMAYAQKGSLLWSSDAKAAMQNFDRAVALAPDDLEVRGYRASFRELAKDDRGAVADFSHMIKLAPQKSLPRYLRAVILGRNPIKDYKAALADVNYLIEQDATLDHGESHPYRNLRHQMRARLREQLGDKPGAIADLKTVITAKEQDLQNNQREQKALTIELEGLRSSVQKLQGK
jgi:tetratricopeptide (TPR) repeat protein